MVSSKESNPTPVPGGIPPTLPPSVEEAYKKKCIELKRRMNEVEENNDAYRLRKVRLVHGIRKMRLERAILLDTLGKRMRKHGSEGFNGAYDDESEGSSEGPPTPQEKPLRSKRGHRRPAQSPHSGSGHRQPINHAAPQLQQHHSSAYSTPIAPHPGPGSFLHTNGSSAIHPNPLSMPNTASFPPNYPQAALLSLPPRPEKPPPAMELYIVHCLHNEIPRNRNLHPNTSMEELREYSMDMWHRLGVQERAHWNQKYMELMGHWRSDMQIWENERQRLGIRGGDGGEEDEQDVKMEGAEEVRGEMDGGFTAVNG